MRPFEKLKARILTRIIAWSGMERQNHQATKGLYLVLIGFFSGCIVFYSLHDGVIYISKIVQYCHQKARCFYCMQYSIHLSWLRSPIGNPCYKK